MTIIIKTGEESFEEGSFHDIMLDLSSPDLEIVTELAYADMTIDLSPYDKRKISMEFIGRSRVDGRPIFAFDTDAADRDIKLDGLLDS